MEKIQKEQITDQQDKHQDRKELHRGVLVNFAGYGLKMLHPILLAVITRMYGAENWGAFVAAQALLLILVRVGMLGLDKGVLWWVPQQKDGEGREALLVLFVRAGLALLLFSLLLAFVAAPVLCQWKGIPNSVPQFRLLALSLFPMGLTDLMIHATMGRRRMEAQVFIKEAQVPLLFVVLSIVIQWIYPGEHGLALGFLLANFSGLYFSWKIFHKMFPKREHAKKEFPQGLFAYSLPIWFAEIGNASVQRLDVIALTALTDLRTVGIYGIVVQFGNALKSIRRGFDPLVVAISSRISAKPDKERMTETFSHATWLVNASQTPVFASIFLLATPILSIYGAEFTEGVWPARWLCLFLVLSGPLQLGSLVVTGFGYSRLTLYNVLLFLGLEAILLWAWIPQWEMTGATFAVGIATLIVALIAVVEMRIVTKHWNYKWKVLEPAFWSLIAGSITAFFIWKEILRLNNWTESVLLTAIFLIVYGSGIWFSKKRR